MAEIVNCIITNSDEGRGAYGIRVDTDENVYFPISIANAVELEEFDTVQAVVIRNDRPDPAWKAIKVRTLDDI